MVQRTRWMVWSLCMAMGIVADVSGAGRGFGGGADVVVSADLSPQGHLSPRPIGGQVALYPVIKELQRVVTLAGPFGGIALPERIGEWGIGPLQETLRTPDGAYALEHTFEDDAAMFYYGDIQDESVLLSLWHSYPEGRGGLSLSGALVEGAEPSTSLSFSEDRTEGGRTDVSGVSLWQDSWGSDNPGGVALLSRYRSFTDATDYGYESEDHAVRSWLSINYEGGGSVSEDGVYSDYWGEVVYLSSQSISFSCSSEGVSLAEYGDVYSTTSDFEDSCSQSESPYHLWEAWSHTEYVWDGTTTMGRYRTSGTITCTDTFGQLVEYAFSQSEGSFEVTYVDTSTGEAVSGMDCAWEPLSEGPAL